MPLVALLFLVVPLVELYVIVQVADVVGIGWTLLLLVLMSVVGAWLVKNQGIAVWRRFNETLARGQIPHREVVDGALVLFAGALLLTPGFVSDVLGLLLLLPPTRAVVRSALVSRFRAAQVLATFGSARFPGRGGRGRAGTDVVDAEGWEAGEPGWDADGPDGRPGELGR